MGNIRSVFQICTRFFKQSWSFLQRLSTQAWVLVAITLVVCGVAATFGFQNYRAASHLRHAQLLDKTSHYSEAQKELAAIRLFLVVPSTAKHIHTEQARNQQLIEIAKKLALAQQLLKEHKTQAALDILKSINSQSGDMGAVSSALQAQVIQLQKTAQTQAKTSSGSGRQNNGSGSGFGGTSGGSSGGSGGSGGRGNSPPAAPQTHFSSCPGALTSSGSYFLDTNVVQTTPTTPCVGVNNVSGVSFDCAGHSITVNSGPAPVSFFNAPNFALKNCNLTVGIGVNGSNSGSVTGNTFAFPQGSGQYLNFTASSSVTFTNNTITNGGLAFSRGSSGGTISGNTISADPTVNSVSISGVVEIDDGANTNISGNHLSGSWHGTPGQGPGSDDGIMLKSSSGNTITNNTIQNVFDCGIETIAQASNEQIFNNTISNAGYCGIGGWFWNSWLNNTVQGNNISTTKLLFQMYVDNSYPLNADERPSTIYFQGNQFISNIFTSGTSSNTNSANINYASQFLPAGITAVTGNNSFQNNNFGTFDAGPSLQPQNAIIDLGGNVCAPIPPSNPQSLTCH